MTAVQELATQQMAAAAFECARLAVAELAQPPAEEVISQSVELYMFKSVFYTLTLQENPIEVEPGKLWLGELLPKHDHDQGFLPKYDFFKFGESEVAIRKYLPDAGTSWLTAKEAKKLQKALVEARRRTPQLPDGASSGRMLGY